MKPLRRPTQSAGTLLAIAAALTIGGAMTPSEATTNAQAHSAINPGAPGLASVRYQIKDIERAIRFYTQVLDFTVEQKAGTAFAMIARGPLHLILSGPGSSGARPMPDGRQQEPGGWNRIVLYVRNLDAQIERMRSTGVRFRNAVEEGPGGKQIQIEDPDGNPIELHEGGGAPAK